VGTKVPMTHEELELGTQVLVCWGHDVGMKVLDPQGHVLSIFCWYTNMHIRTIHNSGSFLCFC
jgi:hypothetical protein